MIYTKFANVSMTSSV